MKNFTKVLAFVLTLVMLVGAFAACKGKEPDKYADLTVSSREVVGITPGAGGTSKVSVTPDLGLVKDADFADYADWETYKGVFGEYYKWLLASQKEADNSSKYVLQAIAEAKLLETGVMVPTSTQGGTYALTRVAYGTANNCLWGLDSERYENLIIATDFIKAADRAELKKTYLELKGTGKYQSFVKQYLTEKGYTIKDSYSFGYSSDPNTWDILKTYRAADSEAIVNTIEGLVSYDCEGRLCYALAKDVTLSADETVYTFTLRDGLKWVNQDGEEYADLTAQDFVDGMKYMLDSNAGLNGLLIGVIKNVDKYLAKEVEFDQVGVKAEGNKVIYTLEEPKSYFLTMLEYNTFFPLCKAYKDSQGEAFGTDPSHILYCGPYIVTNFTSNNKIVFSANESYWAKDQINVKTINWLYNDGKDVTKNYNDAKAGTVDGSGLNATTIPMCKSDGLFDEYVYVSGTNATTYSSFVNIKRGSYETMNGFGMQSAQTEEQKANTAKAVLNLNFRLAIAHAFDRAEYNGAKVGNDTKLESVRNSYTPGNFVKLSRDVEVEINGKKTTFKSGTYYGEIVQAQLDADGSKIKVWNPTGGDGDGSTDAFDGWYNVDAAREYLAKAITELGFEVTKENPIHLDLPYYSASATYTAAAQAYKQSVETALEGKVVLDLIATADIYGWYYAGYYCDYGSECNYNLYDVSGWGPDFGDPSTYLNTFRPNGGDMMHVTGID